MMPPNYHINCALQDHLVAHFKCCDNSFQPSLSSRVDLSDYACKLLIAAKRFEAWSGDQLIGLVAAYCNDPSGFTAFITSVSVLPAYQGQGIAAQLLDNCLKQLRMQGFGLVKLEVNPQNEKAAALYKKYGFRDRDFNGQASTMVLILEGAAR
jgi:ribosomal protein S18 acetylase RimI-like enzyme